MTAEVKIDQSRFNRIFYKFIRSSLFGIARVAFRMEVLGRDNIPKTGNFIAAPIHRSNLDTPLVGSTMIRPVRFMGKQALWSKKWSAWFFSSLGGFGVDREGNPSAALRTALRLAQGGESLAIFAEGTRASGDKIGELQDGVAFIAVRAQIPVVPIAISGTEEILPPHAKFPKFKKAVILIGKPIAPRPAADREARRIAMKQLNEELRAALQDLFDEARRLSAN
jgi:1-acyl-sn-glycerol-3-phosphate acyltransferase